MALVAFLWAGSSHAVKDGDGPFTVLVIAEDDNLAEMSELNRVLEAHLADLSVRVELECFESRPAEITERIEAVRGLLLDSGAISAIWIQRGIDEIFLFVTDRNSRKVFLQTLPSTGTTNWAVECDTVAAMVRSALLTWLESEETALTPAVKPRPQNVEVVPLAPARPVPRMYILATYNLGVVHVEGFSTHGGRFGLGLAVTDFLELGVNACVTSRLRLYIEEADVFFRRFPIWVGVSCYKRVGAFEVGTGLSLVLDITRLEGRAAADARDDTSLNHPGISPQVFVRFFPWRFLAIHADVGADVFFRPYFYTWHGRTVMDYAAVQPRFSVGLSIFFDLR